MNYTIEKIHVDDVLEMLAEYQYALLYGISGIVFCKAADYDGADWDECFEARFFDEDKELHIYEEDGKKCAVKVMGTVDDDCLVKKYELQDRYFGPGRYLCVCEHLKYDEDGQAAVALTRLTGIV